MTRPDLSIVIGSLNRRRLLEYTLQSIRNNGFAGELEIIVVDGGSRDGTCEWLARQRDIFTIIQPNYKIQQPNGTKRRAHTWGEFINLGFRAARAAWIVMISDDVILCPGALQAGYDDLIQRVAQGQQIGGGAFYWRDYPRSCLYHVILLPNRVVHINHGFFSAQALASIGYADETSFEFYGADGDLSMRLNLAGWQTVALGNAFVEHLNHGVDWRKRLMRQVNLSVQKDMATFEARYARFEYQEKNCFKVWSDHTHSARAFWKVSPFSCLQGYLSRQFSPLKRLMSIRIFNLNRQIT